MNVFSSAVSGLLAFTMMAESAGAAELGWDSRLAEMFSGRWRDIQSELVATGRNLENLPGIPIDDQGGTGGYAGVYPSAVPSGNQRYAVEIQWPKKEAEIHMIALVPARRYDAKGLDAQYGLPEAFTVDLLDSEGRVVRRVARERNMSGNRVRHGHPFVYEVSPPVAAAGLRITADRLRADSNGVFVNAWSEAMAFEGAANVALGAKVQSVGGEQLQAPWHWNLPYLVDGETPLGLPEIPAEEHGNIGWISEGRTTAKQSATLTVDLGEVKEIDSVRLLPAKRPTSDLPSGFGFPKKLQVSVSKENKDDWTVLAGREPGNPGHNPVLVGFTPVQARWVRVEATELWKAFDDFPGFFALSELEVLAAGKNVALGKPMQSPDGMMNLIATGGRIWSATALSDGFGPEGRLVSTSDWMEKLDSRLRLETRRSELLAEADHLVDVWRSTVRVTFITIILAGVFLIIALPIRYRLHANRELVKVRERIAGDLHDEVGSNLGSIQMFADLAEGRAGPSEELKRIQRIAAETVSAVRDIVWLLRPTGDHRIGTVEHLRETSSIMLESLDWKFTANEEAWRTELAEEATRDLFLYFREALHNIMRHAKATTVDVRAENLAGTFFKLVISDNGVGISPEKMERTSTLRALRQRASSLAADLKVESSLGTGTRLILIVPLEVKKRKSPPRFWHSKADANELFANDMK